MPAPRVRFGQRAPDIAARFARELLAARAVAGLTQRQVSRRAGVGQTMVSLAERGLRLPSVATMHRLAAATGHDLSIRLFPAGGVPLRDSGQLRVAEVIRARAHPHWRFRLEVPVGPPPDRRAIDLVLDLASEHVAIEVERALLDFQAQLRAAELKRTAMAERIGQNVRLVIALPDTQRNRAAVDAHRSMVVTALPLASTRIWASLRNGAPVGGDGLLWVRPTRAAGPDHRE